MKLYEHGTHNNPVLKIVAMGLFILFPIIGFALGIQYQILTGIPIINPTINLVSKPPNKITQKKGEPYLIKNKKQILFIDTINNYFFDLSSLPEIRLTEPVFGELYELDMYKEVGFLNKSIARFGITEPILNSNNLPLEEIAKQKYGYKLGSANEGMIGDQTTSEIQSDTVGDNYPTISWTEKSNVDEGFFFNKYLIKIDNKYIYIQLSAWNEKVFTQNAYLLRNILSTFRIFE